MHMFKIRSIPLYTVALISLIPSFIKIRLNLTEKKQFKQKPTDDNDGSASQTTHQLCRPLVTEELTNLRTEILRLEFNLTKPSYITM